MCKTYSPTLHNQTHPLNILQSYIPPSTHPVNIKIRLENGATVHCDGMEAGEQVQMKPQKVTLMLKSEAEVTMSTQRALLYFIFPQKGCISDTLGHMRG